MSKAIAIVAKFACLVTIGACTIQETYEDEKLTSRTIGLGLVRAPACDGAPQVVRSRTVGVSVAPSEAALGYAGRHRICIPRDCRAVFLVENRAEVERIRTAIAGLETICAYPEY